MQAELEETARTAASTPHSSTFSSLPSPATPPLDPASAASTGEDTPLPSPSPANRLSPKKSQMDIIYSENKVSLILSDRSLCGGFIEVFQQIKSRSAQSTLSSVSFSLLPNLTVSLSQSNAASHLYPLLSQYRPSIISPVNPPSTIRTSSGTPQDYYVHTSPMHCCML